MNKKLLVMLNVPLEPFQRILPDWTIVYPDGEKFTEGELAAHIVDCDAVVSVYGNKLTNELLAMAEKLKLVANFGAGYDNVDVTYLKANDIALTNSPDPVTEPTAELALGLMIATARRMCEMDAKVRRNEVTWGVMRNLSTTLVGKTVGIIGMGAIGKALARRALASGMKVLYHNRNRVPVETEQELNATFVSMEELLKRSDVVSLNMPLTAQTRGMIGEKELQMMKPQALLINTARGPVVDEQALIQALANKIIAGAGLDVFENEPHIPEALRLMDNVVLIPHLGTATVETRGLMSELVAQNIKAFFEGGEVPNRVEL